MSALLTQVVVLAEESGEHAVSLFWPVLIGGGTLALLLAALAALWAFGNGREHS